MLTALLTAAAESAEIEARFTYRWSEAYEAEARRRLPESLDLQTIRLPNPEDLWASRRGWRRRVVKGVAYGLLVRQAVQLLDLVRLYRIFRRDRADLVHVNNGGFPGAASPNAAAVAARLAGVPVVVYMVNNIAQGYDSPLRWADYPLDRAVARSVTRFVTGSKVAADALTRVLRLEHGRAVALGTGIAPGTPDVPREDTRRSLGVDDGHVLLLAPGRLERPKGHAELINALHRLRDSGYLSSARLAVAGTGPDEDALREHIDRLGMDGVVRVLPHQASLWNLYNAADVVVLPSLEKEDFPNVVLEGMAMAKPVVATRIAGTPEQIVDGVTGILVDAGDEEALADALGRLIADPALRERLGQAGHERFREHFTAEGAVARYWALYRELSAA